MTTATAVSMQWLSDSFSHVLGLDQQAAQPDASHNAAASAAPAAASSDQKLQSTGMLTKERLPADCNMIAEDFHSKQDRCARRDV